MQTILRRTLHLMPPFMCAPECPSFSCRGRLRGAWNSLTGTSHLYSSRPDGHPWSGPQPKPEPAPGPGPLPRRPGKPENEERDRPHAPERRRRQPGRDLGRTQHCDG
jgi:hypothetical protein